MSSYYHKNVHDFKVGDLVEPKNTYGNFAGRKGVVKAAGTGCIITVFWIIAPQRGPRLCREDARFIVPLSA
jgi:hypothetical protein